MHDFSGGAGGGVDLQQRRIAVNAVGAPVELPGGVIESHRVDISRRESGFADILEAVTVGGAASVGIKTYEPAGSAHYAVNLTFVVGRHGISVAVHLVKVGGLAVVEVVGAEPVVVLMLVIVEETVDSAGGRGVGQVRWHVHHIDFLLRARAPRRGVVRGQERTLILVGGRYAVVEGAHLHAGTHPHQSLVQAQLADFAILARLYGVEAGGNRIHIVA